MQASPFPEDNRARLRIARERDQIQKYKMQVLWNQPETLIKTFFCLRYAGLDENELIIVEQP